MQIQSLSREDPLQEEIAIHSSILAWRIPWTEEPGRQSMGSQRVRHIWVTKHTHPHAHTQSINHEGKYEILNIVIKMFFSSEDATEDIRRHSSGGLGLLRWPSGKGSSCQYRRCRLDPWVRRIPWRRKRQPTLVFLPGKSHGQRNVMGCSPWDRKESDTT